MKAKAKITGLFYLGYLLVLAVAVLQSLCSGGLQTLAPYPLLPNLIVWPALGYWYLKANKGLLLMDATMNMAFTWLINALVYDSLRWVVFRYPYGLSLGQLWGGYQPWSTLVYLIILSAPFIGSGLRTLSWRFDKPIGRKQKMVVIGAGIGGLTAAIYAAKAGFDTELYEQHTLVGGECTGWDRKGYHIDNCIHWMMGSTKGTDLNTLWQTVGMLDDDAAVYRADRMYTSHLNGQSLTLWQDIDRTEREMIALSPEDEPEIRTLMNNCRLAKDVSIPAGVASELMGVKGLIGMLRTSGATMKIFKAYRGMNMQDVMDRFKHPLIKRLISDFTPPEHQGNGFAMAYGNFVAGDGGIPTGGSRAAALRMKQRLLSLGGRVFEGCGVEKIVVEGSHATGVQLADGRFVPCDYVIPACDASVTFGKLLPESYMGAKMRRMFENRKAFPVYNTFQVAFALDADAATFSAEENFSCPSLVFTKGMGERITVKTYGYEPRFAPAGKQILQTLQGGSEDVYEFWTALYRDKAAYHQKKLEIAEQTRLALEANYPALQGKLTVLDAWTPITYHRYCGAYKGFYQSFMITKDSGRLPYPPAYVEKLDNVVLGGQWINPPGGLPGSAIASKFAVQRVLNLMGRDYRLQ